jgi:hypothetical protein
VKIILNALGCISPAQITENITNNKALGYQAECHLPNRPPLAIVGGGRSILSHLDELRAWPGDIWGINHTFTWLRDRGIRARFYTADPRYLPDLDIRPGDDVLIATYSDRGLFQQCAAGNVRTFQHWENGVVPGITSAGTALTLAMSLGYGDVTYFGCESSFGGDETHVYVDDVPADLVRVVCNGEAFLSKLEFLHQAILLATAVRGLPDIFKERSGGLLAAMVEDPDWDITHGTRELHAQLRPVA